MTSPTSSNAEQLIGINAKITELQAQRATYIAATVSSLNIGSSTFGADILQPDGTTTTVSGIGSSPQFLPAVGNVVTLALSGAQIIYMPFGVAGGSIDTPQLSTAVNTTISNASTAAASATTTANAAQAAVGTKITTYYAGIAPSSGMTVGDLWINTGSNNTLYRWSGSAWVQVQDQQIQSALTAAGTAQATADGKVQTFYRSTAPANPADNIGVGDLWVDTGHGNALSRWSGTAWVSVQDTSIQAALVAAQAAQATANTKVLVFAQATQPTAQEVGDVWFDTDNGNKMFIWGPTPTVTRINYALNPSFEADATGTLTTIQSWNNYTSGSNGTVTRSIVTTGGVTNASKAVKSSASSQAATAGVGHGFQQSSVAAPGDIYRVQATFQLATTGSNFVPYIQVEWLNASNAVIGTVQTASGSGTLTTNQLLSLTTTAAPSLTASARVTLQRRTVATTGSALATSDVTIDSVLIEKNRDAAAPTTYFDGNTLSNSDSVWGNPNGAPNSTSTIWQPGVSGVNGWQAQQLRTNALQPQSILGNDCIAYGSITAPLLEAILVLAGTVIAGDPNADHAALMTDGLHLFRTVTGEGLQEVGKLAVGSFGTTIQFIDSAGKVVASIDEGGAAHFVAVTIDESASLLGLDLATWVTNSSGGGGPGTPVPGAIHQYGYSGGTVTGVVAETGTTEVEFTLSADRMYCLYPVLTFNRTTATTQLHVRIRDGGSSSPTTSSPVVFERFYNNADPGGYWGQAEGMGLYSPSTSGAHRLWLTVAGEQGGSISIVAGAFPAILLFDLGPARSNVGSANTSTAGGSSPPPVQQNYVELAPAGYTSYRGPGGSGTAGSTRSDTTDVVQGNDPSGFNGQGVGLWWFTLPSITGTVDRVDWYVYTNNTYFNSGGTAIWNIVSTGAAYSAGNISNKQGSGGDQYVGGYPKPGAKVWTMPSSWWSQFVNTPSSGSRAIGVSAGNSVMGTNETYYCRFDGPSARLRIWYTQ